MEQLEQAIEKDLAAVEAKTKEGLAKAAGAAKLTEDEIVEELEDLQQGVRETIETDDFDMGKTLGATTYFYMDFLKALMVVCFVAGCASVPSIRGYRRGRYSTRTRRDRRRLTFPSMSPFCMDYETVTATAGCAHGRAACDARYAPRCALTRRIAAVDAAATGVAVVMLAIFVATVAGKARKIDEAVQTPQDYSVMVTDPDADADDADEWRQFFARFGAVRAVTITRNNARLVGELAGLWRLLACQALARRRARAAALERHVALARRRVRALCGLRYDVSCVFVTFERERDQVACLNALTVGSYSARTDTTGDPRVRKFRGHNVLRVKEAPEPPDVGWRELGSVGGARSTLQKFATVATVAAALVAVSSTIILVATVRRFLMLPSWGDGVIVAVVNAILPQFFKVWSKTFEVHRTESSRQRSLLRQLYAARLLNGIVAVLVTPRWTHMLRRDTLNRLRDILARVPGPREPAGPAQRRRGDPRLHAARRAAAAGLAAVAPRAAGAAGRGPRERRRLLPVVRRLVAAVGVPLERRRGRGRRLRRRRELARDTVRARGAPAARLHARGHAAATVAVRRFAT